MKVKVSEGVTKKDLVLIRKNTIEKAQAYIKTHPKCSLLDLVFKKPYPIITMQFLSDNVICNNCGHIEEKSSYAIAQKAMGNEIIFSCDCGNKIRI